MLENFGSQKRSINICACKVPHRYWPTITSRVSDPYAVSTSTRNFLRFIQITWTMVRTTIQNCNFTASIILSPYVVVIKCNWNASTYSDNWDEKTPYFTNSSLDNKMSSMWPLNSLFITACNFNLWYCRYFYAHRCTAITPSWLFYNSGVQIYVRGVVYNPP